MGVNLDLGSIPPLREPIDAAYAAGQRKALVDVGERQIRKATGVSREIAAIMIASLENDQIEDLIHAIADRT